MAAEASQQRAGLAGDWGEGIGVTSSDGSLHPQTDTGCTERKHLEAKCESCEVVQKGCCKEEVSEDDSVSVKLLGMSESLFHNQANLTEVKSHVVKDRCERETFNALFYGSVTSK